MKDDGIAIIKKSFWRGRRFLLMIFIAVLVACASVGASMFLYNSSGTAQLDLSRPGYVNIRDKAVDSSSEFKNYSDVGTINQAAIDEFKALYDEQADKIKLADAFKGDPLNPDDLITNAVLN